MAIEKIGAFWKRKPGASEKGPVLSGTLEIQDKFLAKEICGMLMQGQKVRIAMWPNKYKDTDTKPDFTVSLSRPPEQGSAPRPQQPARQPVPVTTQKANDDGFFDDIPGF